MNVTVTPATVVPRIPHRACSAVPNAVLMTVLCGVPAVAVTLAAAPAVFVRLKLAGVATPGADAVTV